MDGFFFGHDRCRKLSDLNRSARAGKVGYIADASEGRVKEGPAEAATGTCNETVVAKGAPWLKAGTLDRRGGDI